MDLRAERVTLNRLFAVSGEQFQIPPYQRPYAWESSQVDDLWDDLVSTLNSGHFLGTIVLNTEDENRPQVIDGQQRLTTLMVLLGLIRDRYHEMGSQYAVRVQSLMFSDQFEKGDAKFRLRTGDANWLPFRDLVLRPPDDEERLRWKDVGQIPSDLRARNQALVENARRLYDRLSDWLRQVPEDEHESRLQALEEAIVKKLDIVAIRVGTVADAFLLFETLNDRGLQLSAGDLLKNHLLSQVAQVDGDEEAVRRAAAEWDGLLDDLGPNVDVTRFLRHYLLIQTPGVRKDDVYDRFKIEATRIGPRRLLNELRSYGKLYGEFEDPVRVEDDRVAEVLRDLKTLRAVSCYSALMPARRFLSSDQFIAFARLAEILTYRYSTIVGLDSKDLERVYHRAAKRLADSRGEEIDAAREELIRVIPESSIFVESFMRQRMGVQYLVRYTLGRIEEHISEEREKQLRSNIKVHIEHIMPQTLNDAWREELGDRLDEHDEMVNRWGNLTLLYHKLNLAASNSTFSRKQYEYRNSEVELTRRLCDYQSWGLHEIEERQRKLGELADRIWSVERLRGEIDLPSHPSRRPRLQDHLTEEEVAILEPLCLETTAEEALTLEGRILAHLETLEASHGAGEPVDVELAQQIATVLNKLASASGQLDAEERALLRGAVDYFVLAQDLEGDAGPVGLKDDARVTNAVCEMLGWPELRIAL